MFTLKKYLKTVKNIVLSLAITMIFAIGGNNAAPTTPVKKGWFSSLVDRTFDATVERCLVPATFIAASAVINTINAIDYSYNKAQQATSWFKSCLTNPTATNSPVVKHITESIPVITSIAQLQQATQKLKLLYRQQNIAEPMTISVNQAEIAALLTQITQLLNDNKIDLNQQTDQFYWTFSFPARELLAAKQFEILAGYLAKAKPDMRVSKIIGRHFNRFIGIHNDEITQLITTITSNISALENSGHTQTLAQPAHQQLIMSYCRLWKKLADTDFLRQSLTHNILSAVKYAFSHSSNNSYLCELALCHINDLVTQNSNYRCLSVIIDFMIDHSSSDPKMRATIATRFATYFDQIDPTADKLASDYDGNLSDADTASVCESSSTCTAILGSPSLQSISSQERHSPATFALESTSPITDITRESLSHLKIPRDPKDRRYYDFAAVSALALAKPTTAQAKSALAKGAVYKIGGKTYVC